MGKGTYLGIHDDESSPSFASWHVLGIIVMGSRGIPFPTW
jgi:hypothetical protein